MAERRMFAKNVIDSDLFLDMPLSTQALYFHLAMRADDDGFVNNPKKISRMVGADDDSLKLLCVKQFLIPFESGVVVIRHWRIHNYIQKDRYHSTKYDGERSLLTLQENGAYSMPNEDLDTTCIQDVSRMDTEVRLGKVRLGKVNKERDIEREKNQKHKHGEYKHVLLSDDEYSRLISDYGKETAEEYIRKVDEYCQMKGKSYKDYNLAIRNTFMKRDGVIPTKKNSDPGFDPVNNGRTDF